MKESDAVQQSIDINKAIVDFVGKIDAAAEKSDNPIRFKMTVLKELLEILIAYEKGFTYFVGWIPDQRELADGNAVKQLMAVVGPVIREIPKATQRSVIETVATDLSKQIFHRMADLHSVLLSAT